jgi:DNA-binding NtrC family response regulator
MADYEVRILLVDDDPHVRGLFRKTLERAHFTTSEASSVKEALAALEQSGFDLVVLDLSMPAADGFEVLEFVRRHRPGLPALVVSGVLPQTTLQMAKHLGAAEVLAKPVSPKRLLATVRRLLEGGAAENGC